MSPKRRAVSQVASRPQTTIRIAIADDHMPHRERLKDVLAAEPDFQVVGAASDSREVLELLRGTEPDILLLELKGPNFDGHAILRQLRSIAISTRAIVCTGHDDPEELNEALWLGAKGIVMKESAIDVLTETIRTVHRGKVGLGEYLSRGWIGPQGRDFGAAVQAGRFWHSLTSREREIVLLSLREYRNKEIAAKLSLSVETVRSHLLHIRVKLCVCDRQWIPGARESSVLPVHPICTGPSATDQVREVRAGPVELP